VSSREQAEVFHLMARTAAAEIAERRLQSVDDLWQVAEEFGLVALLGATSVQDAMARAFAPLEWRAHS
jgi:hypothetical protein